MNDNTFDYQKPTEASLEILTIIRAAAKEYAKILIKTLPESREKSIAITKIEETAMWANKSVVQNQTDES